MVSFTYRWDDESNGEIYTERTLEVADDDDDTELTVNNDDNVTASSNPLYVVENGKEYRLVSLHERMQMFEPQKSRVSKTKPDVHAIPEITVEHSKEEHQVGHI